MRNTFRQIWQLISKITNRVVIGDPLLIHAYRSFGNRSEIVFRGRVIENVAITVQQEDSFWKNLIHNNRRFENDELRSIPIHLVYKGERFESYTDREGYFTFRINASGPSETAAIQ